MKAISNLVKIGQNNQTSLIYFTINSGKIIYRDKIDTLIGIKHPGIVLGNDFWGTTWVIHNHYKIGHPQIVTLQEFASGSKLFFDNRPLFYDTVQIIERAIVHWIEKKEYSWLANNCQQFVNKVVQNKKYSETIDKVTDSAMFTGGLVSLVGFLAGNKTAINIGLTIAGVGVAGRTISRLD